MNVLPLSKQIEIIAALCEGVGQRAVARLTDTDRKTVARLALAIGNGCAELHDRMMVGLRVHRIECDELWSFVGHKRNPQKGPKRRPSPVMGDSTRSLRWHRRHGQSSAIAPASATLPPRTISLPTCEAASSAFLRFQRMAGSRTTARSGKPSAPARATALCRRPTA